MNKKGVNQMIRELSEQDAKRVKSLNSESLGYDFSLENTAIKLQAVLCDKAHHLLFGYEDEETKMNDEVE